MMPYFFSNPQYVAGTMYSLESVFRHITESIKGEKDIMRILYNVSKKCNQVGCPGVIAIRNQCHSRELPLFESAQRNDSEPDDASVTELMTNYWERRVDKCLSCKNPLNVTRKFIGHPAILTVSVADMNTYIDESVYFEGIHYSIFAVGYRGHAHFISWMKVENEIFEYDGMVQRGLLRRIGVSVNILKNEITDTSNRRMKAVTVWYSKSSI